MEANTLSARQGFQSLSLAMHWSGPFPEQQAPQEAIRFQDLAQAEGGRDIPRCRMLLRSAIALFKLL